MPVTTGDVVRVWFQSTTPPKFKRCVIITLEPTPVVFLINSRINPYIAANLVAAKAQVCIEASSHPFMEHNSWIDCSAPFSYPAGWIETAVKQDARTVLGRISTELAASVAACVLGCSLIPPKKQATISAFFIAAANPVDDPDDTF